jgi:hypothetical protein
MDNEFKIGEQPEVSEQALERIVDEDIDGATTSPKGSLFGKFESADELLKAYDNLQAEFTRKCQKLSEIQKQTVDKDLKETSVEDETGNISPAFEKEDWRSKVAVFLTENDRAKGFSRDISDEILKDPGLQKNPNMLDIAWARVLAKNYKSPDQIAGDSSFMENYVFSNENIKKQIISSYISEVTKQKTPPVIGSGIKGGASLLTKTNRPASLNDAKVLAEKLFKM